MDEKAKEDLGIKNIERKIQNEVNAEKDWDRFITSFRDVHPSYLKKLSETGSRLSKSETRLACLIKMNLSHKTSPTVSVVISDKICICTFQYKIV